MTTILNPSQAVYDSGQKRLETGVDQRSLHTSAKGMFDSHPEVRRFSFRLTPRLRLGVAAVLLLIVCFGLRIGLSIGRQKSGNDDTDWRDGSLATGLTTAQLTSRSSDDSNPVPVDRVRGIPTTTQQKQVAVDNRNGAAEAFAAEKPAFPEVPGRTRCMLSRRGIIAAAILRPVVEVLVGPGDRVTKDQVLIKLYDLEPQAKVRAREMELRSIESKALFSRRNLDIAENTGNSGAIPFTTLNDLRATAQSNEALVAAAQAELSLAQSELKLYSVTAAIDGEVAWLDVSPGTVSWPGAMIWGEIIDLRELDVRCDLSPAQIAQVAVGQPADVRFEDRAEQVATGKVVFVGKSADRNSGHVPVTVRIANPEERLRADVAVKVRFQERVSED